MKGYYEGWYMKSNKNKPNKPKPMQKIRLMGLHCSTGAVMAVMSVVMKCVNMEVSRIQRRRRQQRKLIQFAKIRQEDFFQSYLNQMLAAAPLQAVISTDLQPAGISMDTLAIASLEKTKSRNLKSIIYQETALSQSIISEDRSQKSKIDRQPSIKLPMETIEEVKFISEMRQKKHNDELLLKKQLEDSSLSKQKRTNKQYKISINFDYNGNILYRRNIQQGNLVLKSIQQKLMKQKIVKRVEQPPQPQEVLPIQKQKYIKRSRSKVVEDEFTEFLDSQSLTDSIEINRGIRYSHNALVFEERKQTLSTKELKSQLGTRKFSKQDLTRVKQFNQKIKQEKIRKIKTEQLKADGLSHQRSLSQANFNSRFRKRQGINIMNPQLRSSMLIRLSEYEPYLVIQKEFPEDPNLYYEPKEADSITNHSEIQKNDVDSRSRMTDRSKLTPKLPPISKNPSIIKAKDDELIISKLQAQLQNKLRI